MENRYLRMRELGVRNIDGYNQALGSGVSIAQLKMAGQSNSRIRRSQRSRGRRY